MGGLILLRARFCNRRTKNLRVSGKTATSMAVLLSLLKTILMSLGLWCFLPGIMGHSSCGRTLLLTREEPGSNTVAPPWAKMAGAPAANGTIMDMAKHPRTGFTLMELLIFSAIFSLIIGAFITILIVMVNIQASQSASGEADSAGSVPRATAAILYRVRAVGGHAAGCFGEFAHIARTGRLIVIRSDESLP